MAEIQLVHTVKKRIRHHVFVYLQNNLDAKPHLRTRHLVS